jgi:hypothetical protein
LDTDQVKDGGVPGLEVGSAVTLALLPIVEKFEIALA